MSGIPLNRPAPSPVAHQYRREGGFTLIEVMITVAIVGILAAIALPAYQSYVMRSNVQPAVQALSADRVRMEQYYMDNRSYSSGNNATCGTGVGSGLTLDSAVSGGLFTVSCTAYVKNGSSVGYQITATGVSGKSMANFIYTISGGSNAGGASIDNVMTSTITQGGGWPASCPSSWAIRPGAC